jgi:uncharacterized damage-inducible protein DinB
MASVCPDRNRVSFCRRDLVLSLNVPTVRDTRLEEALRNFDPSRLSDIAGETGRTTYADLITGIVLHDTYHVSQIQLLKRLATSHREQT